MHFDFDRANRVQKNDSYICIGKSKNHQCEQLAHMFNISQMYDFNIKTACFQCLKNLCKALHKFFRMSKTDLMIRPIYHSLKKRIEAHICISFTACSIYKELERVLNKAKCPFSVKRAAELTHTIYQLEAILPESRKKKTILLEMDEEQKLLTKIIAEMA